MGGGALIAGLLAFLIPGGFLINIALGGIIGGTFGFLSDDPKQKILQKGCEKFTELEEDTSKKVCTKITLMFQEKLEFYSQSIQRAIEISEQLIKQYQLCDSKTVKISEITGNSGGRKIQKLNFDIKQISSQLSSITKKFTESKNSLDS